MCTCGFPTAPAGSAISQHATCTFHEAPGPKQSVRTSGAGCQRAEIEGRPHHAVSLRHPRRVKRLTIDVVDFILVIVVKETIVLSKVESLHVDVVWPGVRTWAG